MASSVTTPSEITTEIQASETLVIENKNGNVALSHAEHGKLYGCASCHGDAVPGAFELGKDTAHTTCKGCHKEQGGPTKCGGCHKK
ncbi:MAG: cytochrome C [Desulfuromusa sp.]|nr:cytochrome C [Desulfuromusa sp.]